MPHIQTSMMVAEQPEPITRDYRGTLIEKGLRVVYNHSGAVSVGTIENLVQNDYRKIRPGIAPMNWWASRFLLEVKNTETGKISKVKNPNSFIII